MHKPDLLKQASFYANDRSDLKLKLLEVYAQSGESDKFNQTYNELAKSGDAEVLNKADALRGDLAEDPSVLNSEVGEYPEEDFTPTIEDDETLDAMEEGNLSTDEAGDSDSVSSFNFDGNSP